MNNEKEYQGILEKFKKIKEKKTNIQDQAELIHLMTGLIGMYAIKKEKKIEELIEEMIRFAKTKKWGIEGTIIEYKNIKEKK